MMVLRSMIAAVLAAAALTACGGQPAAKEQIDMATTADTARDRAMQAGIRLVAEKYPDFSAARKTPALEDRGDTWFFTYELPDDMLGGAPVVVLNKADLSLVNTYRTQ